MLLVLLMLLGLAGGFTPQAAPGQESPAVPRNHYGLPVVERSALYRQQIRRDRDACLVDLQGFVPHLRVRLAYATADNPTHRVLYRSRRTYLRLPAALALRGAQRELARRGLGLVVFDAYRPYRATLILWLAVRDPAFAAPPWSGSVHNRAAAVDVTLVDLRSGRQLPMPTAYDTFSPRASQHYTGLPPAVARNRDLLRLVMRAARLRTAG